MKGLAVLSFMKNSCLGTGLSGAMGGIKINPKEYSEMELQKIVSLYVTELFKKGYCKYIYYIIIITILNTITSTLTFIAQNIKYRNTTLV